MYVKTRRESTPPVSTGEGHRACLAWHLQKAKGIWQVACDGFPRTESFVIDNEAAKVWSVVIANGIQRGCLKMGPGQRPSDNSAGLEVYV